MAKKALSYKKLTSPIKRININSMLENEIRNNFARNVKELRIDRKLNQIQLGEKLSYSSKAISKWENGDVIPDITTLKMIADFFEISVDTLISNKNVVRRSHRKRNRALITISSSILSFFVAAIVFLILSLVHFEKAWMSFIIAIPVSAIVLIVFSSIWYKKKHIILSTIYLVISAALMTMLLMNFYFWWIVVIIAAILCVLAIIFFQISFTKNK